MAACERFGKVLQFFGGAVLLGVVFSACRYPFFIGYNDSGGSWVIQNPSSVEGNLLVFASILIGVAVIQAQNLNRMKDILRAMRARQRGGLSGMLDSEQFMNFVKELQTDVESIPRIKCRTVVEKLIIAVDAFRCDTHGVSESLNKTLEVYEFLLRGFWLLSLAIIVVIFTLAFAVLAGTSLSPLAAFILSTGWWTTIWLIVIGWGCLATVAWRSYMYEKGN